MRTAPAHARPRATRPVRLSPTAVLWMAGGAVVLFVFICYWPLTRYFFAQDDFVLLERAGRGFRDALEPYFNTRPGQFRPLTKGLYFLFTWPLFKLNPLPYHVVSLALHALNSILVGAVLRRFGISKTVSWAATVLFAANLCHMEAVAWISCVQQLLGAAFVFTALIYGVDALRGGGRRAQLAAAVAYALALASYEQTRAAPLVLLTWAWVTDGGRAAWRAAWGPLRAMFVLLAVYAAYTLVRGAPDSGPYVLSVGKNVADNLRAYTGIVFSFWLVYPAYGLPTGFTLSHGMWIAVLLSHTFLRSMRDLMFGCAAFLLFLAPVLFTTEHAHSFHLYVPAIGAWFLLGSIADSLRRLAAGAWSRQVAVLCTVAAVVAAAGSVPAVHRNMNATVAGAPLPRSFVLRRAVLAERLCSHIKSRWTGTTTGRLVLFYPGTRPANYRNVESALGYGSAVRLVLQQPDLNVVFVPPAPMPDSVLTSEMMVFTELGGCYTVEEWRELERSGQSRAQGSPIVK